MSLVMVIFVPLVYIIGRFIGGIIAAFIYNLVAGWLGGVEIVFAEETP